MDQTKWFGSLRTPCQKVRRYSFMCLVTSPRTATYQWFTLQDTFNRYTIQSTASSSAGAPDVLNGGSFLNVFQSSERIEAPRCANR